MPNIKTNIDNIQNIVANTKKSPLFNNDIKIIAVTKNQPSEKIEEAILAGITHFGENYVQEAQKKWVALKKKYPHIKLHLIGHLQRNKVKEALSIFDVIQTIDNPALITVIAKEIQKNSVDIITKEFFMQLNLASSEEINIENNNRSGITVDKLRQLFTFSKDNGLLITGLMAILPDDNIRYPYFAFLKNLQKQYTLPHLSMGMSNDFPQAVQFGASFIRIGTAIFKN